METETPVSEALDMAGKPGSTIRTVLLVLLCVLALVGGIAEASSSVADHQAAVIDAKVAPLAQRVSVLETSDGKRSEDIGQIKSDVAVIRQLILDRLPEPSRK